MSCFWRFKVAVEAVVLGLDVMDIQLMRWVLIAIFFFLYYKLVTCHVAINGRRSNEPASLLYNGLLKKIHPCDRRLTQDCNIHNPTPREPGSPEGIYSRIYSRRPLDHLDDADMESVLSDCDSLETAA